MPYKRGAPRGNQHRLTHGYYSGDAVARRQRMGKVGPRLRVLLTLERQIAEIFGGADAVRQRSLAAGLLRRIVLLQEHEQLANRHDHQRDGG